MSSAEIITIGTEILLGEIVDTNTRHIARVLRGLGVDLFRTTTIGDNVPRIAEAIRDAADRAEIVITTGGLGPTVDDPTREAVARAAGVALEFREDLWEQVLAAFARFGRSPTENQRRQAFAPKGAKGIRNPVGTAPCFAVDMGRGVVIVLPGVPNEMEHILRESVVPLLQDRFQLDQILKIRVLHIAGLGEGVIDQQIADLEALANPSVGLAAHTGVVDVRIAAKAGNEAAADAMIAEIEADVRRRLGDAVFGADEDRLEDVALAAAATRGWTRVVGLESNANGLLARKLPLTTVVAGLSPAGLLDALRRARKESEADVALGVAVHPDDRAADLVLITPNGEKTRHLGYGGPPRSLANWGVNVALDWLRRKALEVD